MKAETFKIKKIQVIRDKRSYKVDFELAGGEWSNFFELPIKKEDTINSIETAITRKVKDMVANKDMENELMTTIANKGIPFLVIPDTIKKDGADKKNS